MDVNDGKYVVDANTDKDVINKILGITSAADAIANNTITVDQNCTGITPGQLLLIFDSNNNYIHTAKYEGNGIYSTKNGMGDGTTGVQNMSLQQIKDIYYTPGAGGTKSAYTNAPGKVSSSSNIGESSDGFGTQTNINNAKSPSCTCP